MTQSAVAAELGITPATVAYHVRRLGRAPRSACGRRYDWTAIQAAYDAGLTVRQCQAAFGFNLASWSAAVSRGAVVARPKALVIDELLVAGRVRNRVHVKRRLFAASLKARRCEACGISDWRAQPLTLALHHVNGDGTDNRLENLQLLCANCHSQTPNFAGRKTAGASSEEAAAGSVRSR